MKEVLRGFGDAIAIFAVCIALISGMAANAQNTIFGVAAPGDMCPSWDWDESIVPGWDPANQAKFTRDQGGSDEHGVGHCGAYTMADKICADLKLMGKWPADNVYKAGCSVFDIDILGYDQLVQKDGATNTIESFLEARDYAPADLLLQAQEIGICPESLFPNDIASENPLRDSLGYPRPEPKRIYLAAAAHFKKVKAAISARLSLRIDCPECRLIAPTLTHDQWQEVRALLEVTNLEKDDFAIIKKMNQLACAGNRIRLPSSYTLKSLEGALPYRTLQILKQRLLNRETLPIAFDAHDLDPLGAPLKESGHYALLLGAAMNPSVADLNSAERSVAGCYYIVKSSWGARSCISSQKKRGKLDPDVLCVPESGEYAVSEKKLQQMIGNRLQFFSATTRLPATARAACDYFQPSQHLTTRYDINGSEVYDTQTNLTWQRCSLGQQWRDGVGCEGTVAEIPWQDAMKQTSRGWRLPTSQELASLVSPTCQHPAINEEAFPSLDLDKDVYWTSTEEPDAKKATVAFNSDYGGGGSAAPDSLHPVRLVRSGK